ncbi:hypothetical protein L596_008700 [Steinernema carpocapsae]|uniref:Uncharacterized protein n=1 Tax=Steinernema carpocapsae TaxID=34508 RepID=A0A4U5PDA3_STECR|nr:hypothetical protein L596_008700 [Steinernema carpocapsae]
MTLLTSCFTMCLRSCCTFTLQTCSYQFGCAVINPRIQIVNVWQFDLLGKCRMTTILTKKGNKVDEAEDSNSGYKILKFRFACDQCKSGVDIATRRS